MYADRAFLQLILTYTRVCISYKIPIHSHDFTYAQNVSKPQEARARQRVMLASFSARTGREGKSAGGTRTLASKDPVRDSRLAGQQH